MSTQNTNKEYYLPAYEPNTGQFIQGNQLRKKGGSFYKTEETVNVKFVINSALENWGMNKLIVSSTPCCNFILGTPLLLLLEPERAKYYLDNLDSFMESTEVFDPSGATNVTKKEPYSIAIPVQNRLVRVKLSKILRDSKTVEKVITILAVLIGNYCKNTKCQNESDVPWELMLFGNCLNNGAFNFKYIRRKVIFSTETTSSKVDYNLNDYYQTYLEARKIKSGKQNI